MYKYILLSFFVFFNTKLCGSMFESALKSGLGKTLLLAGVAGIATTWDNKFSILETIGEKTVLPFFPKIESSFHNPFLQPLISATLFSLEESYKAKVTEKISLSLKNKIILNTGLHGTKNLLNLHGYTVTSAFDSLPSSNNVFVHYIISFCRNFWMLVLTPERITALTDFAYRLSKAQ